MPAYLPILAACIMTIAPAFVAANIFIVLLYLWVGRRLRTDPVVHERLHIDMAEDAFGWALAPGAADRRWPFVPLIGTALVAIALTAGETALFVAASDVPRFWYLSGAIAALVMAVLPFGLAALFRRALARRVNLLLAQHANGRFAFAFSILFTVSQIDAQANDIHASLGLRPRVDARMGAQTGTLESCRRILIAHAAAKPDVALAALGAAKTAAERDLGYLRSFASDIKAGTTLVERVKSVPDEAGTLKGEIERIEEAIHSGRLAAALEAGQWSDASLVIETIRPDLDRLSAIAGADSGMPQSVEDAYRVLNVRDDTPLDSIKTIVSAYWRIWHADLARDEAERALFTLKMQKLNVAWDLIQQARGVAGRDGGAPGA
jgi:hypothetical protein